MKDELCGPSGIEDVAIPEANDAPTLRFEIRGALGVVIDLIAMLAAVDLDHEFCFAVG